MRTTPPKISVVVPTCQRTASLERLLQALARQDLPQGQFEVIVVADGDPKAVEFLGQCSFPGQLRHVLQPLSGAGPARNLGATLASAPVLLFLDDDVEPDSSLVRMHLEAAYRSDSVWLGNLITAIPQPPTYLAIGTRLWWEGKLRRMREPGHRFDYADLLSGHFSVPTSLFRKLGGFDPSFRCREDYEFGARLMKLGVPFQLLASACALHHENPTLAKALGRSRAEGAADVRLARAHPELMLSLGLARFHKGLGRKERLALGNPRISEAAARRLQSILPRLEKLGLRRYWNTYFVRLKRFWYMRGMQSECADWSELGRIPARTEPVPEPSLTLDLAKGIPWAEAELDRHAPESVRLFFSDHPVAVIPAQAAAEPVRGRHLKPFLRDGAGYELLVGVAWKTLAKADQA